MRQLYLLLVSLLLSVSAHAQEASYYQEIGKVDISNVIFPDSIMLEDGATFPYNELLGAIGSDYQRFYNHFTDIRPSPSNTYLYHVKGKTKVKEHICGFTGELLITNCITRTGEFGLDENRGPKTEVIVTSALTLYEDSSMHHAGTINGTLQTDLYINKDKQLQYNALNAGFSDGYKNNQFAGRWTSYETGKSKPCDWGDSRIPNSGDLDMGAAEFSPADKYLLKGWQSYRDLFSGNEAIRKAAQQKEQEQWWK